MLGVEAVLPDGELVQLGGAALDAPGLDLLGVLVGSEGTLAVVTKATLRILRRPEAVLTLLAGFDSIDAAGGAVSAIIARGIVPAAVEMMDRLTIEAAEAAVHPNFPNADAVLIVELDGPQVEVDELFAIVETVCRHARRGDGRDRARPGGQRERIWKGRKAAFAAMGRVSPNYYVQDGVVPRTQAARGAAADPRARSAIRAAHRQRLPRRRRQPASAHLLRRADAGPGGARREGRVRDPAVLHRGRRRRSPASTASAPTRRRYMPKMFARRRPRRHAAACAARSIRPGICNPGKVFPTPRLCGEVPGPYRAASARARRPRGALLMAPRPLRDTGTTRRRSRRMLRRRRGAEPASRSCREGDRHEAALARTPSARRRRAMLVDGTA